MSATKTGTQPPLIPELLLRLFLPAGRVRDSVIGDLCEEYGDLAAARGGGSARAWFWRQALQMGGYYFLARVRRRREPAATDHGADIEGATNGRPPRQTRSRSGRAWSTADLLQSLRISARVLLKQPGFSLVAVLTLALAIGANTAIFSLVNAVLLRPLPLPEPESLVRVFHAAPGFDGEADDIGLTTATYFLFRDSGVLEDLALFNYTAVNLSGGEAPERVRSAHVSHSIFDTLGVPPAMGRTFRPEDERPGSPPVVILADAFWKSQFGGRADIIGKTVHVDGELREIVGVMPAGMEFPRTGTRLWVPMELDPNDVDLGRFGTPSVARLLPGVSLQQTSARLAGLLENLTDVFPDENSAPGLEEAGLTAAVKPLQEYFVGDVRQPLTILLASVGFILLIACANVANLFLVRADGRDREMAVRAALGASRGRIVRSFLAESCLLGIASGGIGLLLAYVGLRALVRLGPSSVPRLEEIGIDTTVLIFTFLVSLLAGALFGLLPAFRSKPAWLSAALKEGGRAQSIGRGRQRARSTLVGAQVALAVVLLVGSGLMVRTYQTLTAVDLGFDPDNVLTFRLMLPTNDYPGAEAPARFVRRVVDEIGALPGVQSAGAVHQLPLGYSVSSMGFIAEDSSRDGSEPAQFHFFKRTTPGFFESLQIPLLAGRTLEWADQEERRAVAVVSEAVANEYWPGQNPIGKRIQAGDSSSEPDPALWLTIVGVVGNVRNLNLEEENGEIVYLPLLPIAADSAYEPRFMGFVVRGHGDPTELVDSIRAAVQRLDPNLPLANVETMQYLVEWAREDDAFLMTLLLVGAGGALLIGAVGIYGVVSYVVSQRTHEIGVRMALGARTSEIGWMVLRRSLLVTMSGVVAGVAAALVLSSFMRSLLYGVAPMDPATFTAVPILLIAVALLATWLPARRAARTDPLKALRFD